ncbi:hypothetical protein [Terriglobus sp. TAA 43]|uniref:hypothetical protein n=1 Tax=Terriglobus sp. TAA 43 TaxID=278961 RepID=UPI0018DB676C|nr:hypothetical protein [Terriglobus sp. TAA 43]
MKIDHQHESNRATVGKHDRNAADSRRGQRVLLACFVGFVHKIETQRDVPAQGCEQEAENEAYDTEQKRKRHTFS